MKKLISASLIGMAMAAGAVQAATIPLPAGLSTLEDDNLEFLSRKDANGNYQIVQRSAFGSLSPSTVQVGDRLTAVIEFGTVRNPNNTPFFGMNPFTNGVTELTGVSEIEAIGFFQDGFGNQRIEWGVSSAFETTYGVSGAMVLLFADTNSDFSVGCSSATVSDCITPATNGSRWLTLGKSDNDDYWSSTGAGAPFSNVATLASGSAFGQANFALSILENNTGYLFDQLNDTINTVTNKNAVLNGGLIGDGYVDLIGSGQLLGGAGLNGPWFARSDFDLDLNRIPEPGSLALLGIGLLALSRSKKAHQA